MPLYVGDALVTVNGCYLEYGLHLVSNMLIVSVGTEVQNGAFARLNFSKTILGL